MDINESIQVRGAWTFVWTDENGNEIRRREEKNKIVNTGLYAIAAIMINELPQTCAVYLGMGTGTDAVLSSDTMLGAETVRKIVTTKTRNNGEIIYRFYWLTGEAVGSFTEWGVFLEATDILNSGRLLNRLIPVGGVPKASNENLIVEVRIALTAA